MKAERDMIYMGEIYLKGSDLPKGFKPKDKKDKIGASQVVKVHRPEGVPADDEDENPLTKPYTLDELEALDTKSLTALAKHRDIEVEPTEGWSEQAERAQIIDKVITKQKAGTQDE